MSRLLSPLTLRGTTFRNRIFVSPMCMYSATDGLPADWHLVHLGARAVGGAGLVLTEATAVSPEGRISPEDTGIWNDEQAAAWARVTAFVREQGAVPGIQLAHAGPQGLAPTGPGTSGRGSVPVAEGGWPTVAPSAVAFGRYAEPAALDPAGIDKVVTDFVAASRRAVSRRLRGRGAARRPRLPAARVPQPAGQHQRTDGYGGDLRRARRGCCWRSSSRCGAS